MKTIVIDRFDGGIADDRLAPAVGEFGWAKHFDVLTNPRRLQPLRGMSSHTSNTAIGNLIVASDGLMYGAGEDANNPGFGKLWVCSGYGSGDGFAALSTNQLSGGILNADLLVDWPDAGNSRKIIWASANLLVASNYSGGAAGTSTHSLTFSTIGQGFVHPKDKYLYYPYRTSSAGYIGLIAPNATAFSGANDTAFALPAQYRAYCLTNYGNYLAIPLTSISAVSLVNSSFVGLWDRDTTNSLFNETIPWGNGRLVVLNNVSGALVGVSLLGDDSLQAGTSQDYNSVQIKVWDGGAEPTLIKEIKAIGLSGASGKPSVTISTRVNFVNNNRLYFAIKVDPNDGIQPSRIGLFSVGKNKYGRWTVQHERMATNDGSETSIIAAVIVGDYVETVHTAAGTLTKSTNGNPSSSTFGATSVYESGANPGMSPLDSAIDKQLYTFAAYFEPLPASATVVLKYRVDSKGNDSDWVTVGTANTAGDTSIEMENANGSEFTAGGSYEFRLESTGGAVITAFGYKYQTFTSKLLA